MAIKPSLEPVVYASAIQAIIGALITAGWLVIPSDTASSLATVVGLIIATIVGAVARHSVKPVAKINVVADQPANVPVDPLPPEVEDPSAHAGGPAGP